MKGLTTLTHYIPDPRCHSLNFKQACPEAPRQEASHISYEPTAQLIVFQI